ncbi:mandelate racemase/muconate lactonizing enzyme family protein [Acidovorax sp.]|uniref:mandelate racemase/muconate lactonizing enzyme family protein n=1 Tax=Acidovorax sp. TaxID=1872122 RepID=UPI002ACD3C5C|nr:mandelate racemase/muconate lactonizing enzyme family protein [Acidovorax sp.]MDZ7863537.1 mandelate racemase/muconate lactonizing enzyme family protein [Acidovorax sp.]
MKIKEIRCHLMQAGAPPQTGWTGTGKSVLATSRNWLFVTVLTDNGLVGTGEGSGWPRAVAEAVQDLAHVLVGEDARGIERLWQRMRVACMGHGQTGVVGMGAINAIDMALWDIKAQALGVPLYELLGGATRIQVPFYVHAATPEAAIAAVAAGATGIKVGGIAQVVERAHAVRAAIGPEVDLMCDLHGPPWLAPADAVAIGRELEPLHLLFLEEPVAPDDIRGWRLVRDKVALPLAGGERLATLQDMKPFLTEGLLDVVQPDGGRFGGITQMKKLAGMAEAFSVTVAPHSGSLGPVAEVAMVHLLSAIPNALILERMAPDWEGRAQVMDSGLLVERGFLQAGTEPGLDVRLREDFIAAHPSQRNVGLATGGWNAGTDHESVYMQARRPRARIGRDDKP